MIKQYGQFFLILIFVHCSSNSDTHKIEKQKLKVSDFSWLVNNWLVHSKTDTLIENWKVVNDTMLQAETFILMKDTTYKLEKIEIQLVDTTAFFIPTLISNKQEPVKFYLTNINKSSFTFENTTHDFPQKIRYIKTAPNKIMAIVSGKHNAVYKADTFNFRAFQINK